MPSALISVYLNDAEYMKYAAKKEDINSKIREFLKKQLKE